MRARAGLVTIVLVLPFLAGGLTSATASTADGRFPPIPGQRTPSYPSSCTVITGGYRCELGPIDVGAGQMVQITQAVEPPNQAGYITSARATLVDGSGVEVDHHMVHLHHAVWLNPLNEDYTCDSFDGVLPNYQRFFASGKERTVLQLPPNHGYHWTNQNGPFFGVPWWGIAVMLDGMEGMDDVTVRLDIGFVPDASAAGYTPVTPVWLDVKNCQTDPVFQVRKGSGENGRFEKRWRYRMPEGGEFMAIGGHLHDGGLRLVLENRTTDHVVFRSRALYEMMDEPWYLTGMTSFSGDPGKPVSAGDVLRLRAIYDSTHRWRDVMGIMLGAFVPQA